MNAIVQSPITVSLMSQPTTLVVSVNRGEKGDPGVGGSGSLPSLIVAQTISALRIVSNLNGQYDYANPLDPIASWSIVGITLQSINTGNLLTPVNNQPVTDQSWNWVRGSPVFLGPLGTLTQIPPVTGNLVVVARVFDPKTLFIHIEDAIQL